MIIGLVRDKNELCAATIASVGRDMMTATLEKTDDEEQFTGAAILAYAESLIGNEFESIGQVRYFLVGDSYAEVAFIGIRNPHFSHDRKNEEPVVLGL